jgi:hypothetical protein
MSQVDKLDPEEILYRSIPPNSESVTNWVHDENRPSSACFKKQIGGISTDRKNNREESDVIESLKNRFNTYAVIKWSVESCHEIGTCALSDPKSDNEFHAVIVNDKCDKKDPFLKSSTIRKLIKKRKNVFIKN